MVRRNKRDDAEQAGPVNRLPLPPLAPDTDGPLPDWREIGRRVLGESQRRTARDLRRRNGCKVNPDRFQGKWRGSS